MVTRFNLYAHTGYPSGSSNFTAKKANIDVDSSDVISGQLQLSADYTTPNPTPATINIDLHAREHNNTVNDYYNDSYEGDDILSHAQISISTIKRLYRPVKKANTPSRTHILSNSEEITADIERVGYMERDRNSGDLALVSEVPSPGTSQLNVNHLMYIVFRLTVSIRPTQDEILTVIAPYFVCRYSD